VDIEPDTANIDPNLIEDTITPRTKAVLPVDAFGQPARLDTIRDIADRSKTCLGHAAQGRASTCPSCAE